MIIKQTFAYLASGVLSLLIILFSSQTLAREPVHPRGIIKVGEVEMIRERIKKEPYSNIFRILHQQTLQLADELNEQSELEVSRLAMHYSYMYLLTEDKQYAQNSFRVLSLLETNTTVLSDILFRGLNKATVLRDLAITYDFCFHAWEPTQRKKVLEMLWFLMVSVNSNMGFEANPPLESNWMGIRWSSVMLASLVWDDMENDRSSALPFLWDVIKRVEEHAGRNIFSNGWNGESMNYFSYNWSFIAPAIIALQNNHEGDPFALEKYIPNSLNAMWARSIVSVAMQSRLRPGVQVDFSVDDHRASTLLFPIALRLFPSDQQGYLRWMNHYLVNPEKYTYDGEQLFYFLAWDNSDISPENPAKGGWLNYHDPDQGVVMFRNRYQDDHDIVAGITATSKRIRGHQSYDNLGFRIVGLGSIWAIGAGRTGQVAGHTTLFPTGDISKMKGLPGILGVLEGFAFEDNGSGYAVATENCMGVLHHRRYFRVDYSGNTGLDALFIVSDQFDGDAIWRMNTPEFNHLDIDDQGFTLTAPNGSTMRGVVFTPDGQPMISAEKVRYGGDTQRLNPGICLHGECYEYSIAIDVECSENIVVILTLQKPGGKLPAIIFDWNGNGAMVNGIKYNW
jgi:hypothetical protein